MKAEKEKALKSLKTLKVNHDVSLVLLFYRNVKERQLKFVCNDLFAT